MDNLVKVAVDAMGGDYAPAEPVKGAVDALAASENIYVFLVGKKDLLEQELKNEIRQRKINKLKYGPYYVKNYLLPDNSFAQFRSDMNVPYKEIMPLCVKENGELLTPDSFKYCARVVHYELGNKLFHSHCLRHTHGTILAENGVNPKTVMERLGHKDIKTTLQTYTFNTNVMQQNAVDIFEKATQA